MPGTDLLTVRQRQIVKTLSAQSPSTDPNSPLRANMALVLVPHRNIRKFSIFVSVTTNVILAWRGYPIIRGRRPQLFSKAPMLGECRHAKAGRLKPIPQNRALCPDLRRTAPERKKARSRSFSASCANRAWALHFLVAFLIASSRSESNEVWRKLLAAVQTFAVQG